LGKCENIFGDPRTIAPEVISNGGDFASRFSDIWALGCIVFFIASGSMPWSNVNFLDKILQIVRYA